MSPSPRRAWIEIMCIRVLAKQARVALPMKGVDRNNSVC